MAERGVHRGDMFDDDPTLAAFARDLQDAAAASPAPAIGASLAAVLEGRAPATVYPELVAPRRRPRAARPTRLRWAVAGAAFGLGAGSLGIAGALPGPVQREVARLADVVGVNLPDGDDAPATTTTTVPPATTRPTTTTEAPTTTVAPPVGTTGGSNGNEKPEKPEDGNRGQGNDDDGDDGQDEDSSGPGSGDESQDDDEHGDDRGSDDSGRERGRANDAADDAAD